MPAVSPQPKLKRDQGTGFNWNPIIDWTLEEVLDCIKSHGLALHQAYTQFSLSRVSCKFCIMSAHADPVASSRCEDNHPVYRHLVDLEIKSTFGFQENTWLADIAPHLLSTETRQALAQAKHRAHTRETAEKKIPKHLLYTKGWPTCIPTAEEAQLLAHVRKTVSQTVGFTANYLNAASIIARYQFLYRQSREKEHNV
jgi:3'-phosphoadenosine 5'-phosphosulfate sulfotransferase (PAPS reductase)/FAD synthetase